MDEMCIFYVVVTVTGLKC